MAEDRVMGAGEVAMKLGVAATLGSGFPASVPDTPANRAVFAQIKREVADLKARGITPDIPRE